jgi:transcriptional regulator GlxA family with amidase domain
MTTVAIVLFDGVEELDFAGPWEVFRAAAWDDGRFDAFTVAETDGVVTCANGLRVLADRTFDQVERADVLIVPGGKGTRHPTPALLAFIRRIDATSSWTTSVCTGSFLLAEAGPAVGKRVATYWEETGALRAGGLVAAVAEGERWVRDGKIVTAAGVSAGIDMSLWLLGELVSPDFSRQVRRNIEYDPAPPY